MLSIVALAVLCADPMVIEGTVPDDASEFFTVPFTVAPGTVELEIRHDDLSSSNILDWGLFAADGGFVGWGGGNSEPALVGPLASSRSYSLATLTPGTWNVLVGKALVTQKPAKYRLEIESRTTPTLSAQQRTAWMPVTLAVSSRFYAGDLHVHSTQSGDARATLDEIAALAAKRGLDFVALSEHNTLTTLDFLNDAQSRSPTVLLVPSVEFTTYAGHLNAFGATQLPDFWFGVSNRTLADAVADFAAQGAVPTVNHPTLDLGTFCIGCAWEHGAVDGLAAVEVGVGGWDETGSLFDESALAFWEAQASRGIHLTAVGGSDDHRAGVGRNQTQSELGSPTTMIFAHELSVAGLTRGLLDGRTVVKLRGPDDPMIEVVLPNMAHDRDTYLGEQVELSARVTGGVGHTLVWIENGVVARTDQIDVSPFSADFVLKAPSGNTARVRAEVRVDQQPRTVTSFVWVGTSRGLPPVVSPKPSSCSSVPLVSIALLGLWALRRARRGK
ncbi:MAG: PHP domain-containing protein [Archangium sp.]|nr:PHP domain-containing protein [Archangium sp.]